MLIPEDAHAEGNADDIEAVSEEVAEDFSSSDCHYIEEGASRNMLANI